MIDTSTSSPAPTNGDQTDTIYILMDTEDSEYAKFSGPVGMSPEELRKQFAALTRGVGLAIEAATSAVNDYQLAEIELEAGFDAEVGLALVGKTGVRGGIKLTYKHK